MILQTFSDTQRVYAVDESIGKGTKVKNNLGANIRGFRKNKGFTQEELAGMLGVTPQAVSRWESEAGLPDVSMVVPIAQALNVTTDMLLGYNPSNKDDYLLENVKNKIKRQKHEKAWKKYLDFSSSQRFILLHDVIKSHEIGVVLCLERMERHWHLVGMAEQVQCSRRHVVGFHPVNAETAACHAHILGDDGECCA